MLCNQSETRMHEKKPETVGLIPSAYAPGDHSLVLTRNPTSISVISTISTPLSKQIRIWASSSSYGGIWGFDCLVGVG
jgi:hypothetical protein